MVMPSTTFTPRGKWARPFFLGALLLAGAILLKVLVSSEPRPTQIWTVDDLLRVRNELSDQLVRVRGAMVSGSLTRQRRWPCSAEFRIAGKQDELLVRYTECEVPDGLCNRPRWPTEITLEGRLGGAGTRIDADTVFVMVEGKCEMVERPDGKVSCAPACL
jgi:cytochrome c-type biogenesis protein CcmE